MTTIPAQWICVLHQQERVSTRSLRMAPAALMPIFAMARKHARTAPARREHR
jgi:hypothetical protein